MVDGKLAGAPDDAAGGLPDGPPGPGATPVEEDAGPRPPIPLDMAGGGPEDEEA